MVCGFSGKTNGDIDSALLAAFPNCELIIAESAAQCLKLIEEANPDLVISGLDLPDMPGLDLIGRIRRISKVPIIILSDSGDDLELIKAMKEGADRYIKTPITDNEFIIRTKALLRRESIDNAAWASKGNPGTRIKIMLVEGGTQGGNIS